MASKSTKITVKDTVQIVDGIRSKGHKRGTAYRGVQIRGTVTEDGVTRQSKIFINDYLLELVDRNLAEAKKLIAGKAKAKKAA